MSLLLNRDLDHARAELAAWLAAKMPEARDLELSAVTAPPSTGFSNETLLFDARWREDGAPRERGLVVRIKSTGFQIFPRYDIERQYRVMEILGAKSDVPVPGVYGYEPDPGRLGAPFFVMERIDGQIPPDAPPYHLMGWVTELSPDERARVWWSGVEAMARVHRVDWRALGFGFLETEGRGTPIERQLDDYERYLSWAAGDEPPPLFTRALRWLRDHLPRGQEPAGLCWGDSRIGNMIFRDERCVAVLDWEMATIANPEQDLAWWLFFDRHHSEGCDAPRLEGFPGREETIERYREWSGLAPRHLDYYELFAAFRFSVIMIRVGQHLIAAGIMPGNSGIERDNTATKMLAKML